MPAAAKPYKIALAPIHWMASSDGRLDRQLAPETHELFGLVRKAGFRAIAADLPAGATTAVFRDALDKAGLAPAPGYFSVRLSGNAKIKEVIETARPAAAAQAELGLDAMFIGCGTSPGSPRDLLPAIGAASDPGTLDRFIDCIGEVALAMRREGIKGALHPHVGSPIETEQEILRALTAIEVSVLDLGPDTGHCAWAGIDVPALFETFKGRIRLVHVKDIDEDVRARALKDRLSYPRTVLAGLWREPGQGSVDLEKAIAALGPEFDGWLIGEVDRSDLAPFDCARITAEWLYSLERPSLPQLPPVSP